MLVLSVLLGLVIILLGILLWAGGGKTIHEAQGSGIIEAIPNAWEQLPAPANTVVLLSYHLGYALEGQPWRTTALDVAGMCDRLDRIVEMIAASGADVALLQAVDFASQRSHNIDQLHYIAEALGWGFAARTLTWECRYLPYPFWPLGRPLGRVRAGMGVISRYPLVQNTRQRLSHASPLPGLAWLFYPYHTVQMVDVQCGNQTLRVLHGHLAEYGPAVRRQQARELVDFVGQVETPTSVLMGAWQAADPGEHTPHLERHGSGEAPMEIIVSGLRHRFRSVPEVPTAPGSQRALLGSGLRAVETWAIPLDEPGHAQLPLVVRLHWVLPMVVTDGSSAHERL